MIDTGTAREIAGSAEFLHERVSRNHEGTAEDGLASQIRRSEAVASRRFNLSPRELDRYVAFERLPEEEPLPDWWGIFQAVIERVEATEMVPENDGDRPFESVLAPIIEYATDRWWVDSTLIGGEVKGDSRGYLADRLLAVLGKVLQKEFVAWMPDELERDPTTMEAYGRFVTQLSDGGLLAVFEAYPVGARLIAETVRQWGETITEFTAHVEEDHPRLCQTFDEELEEVSSVQMLGDSHEKGRSVMGVEFQSGQRLIYKPRSLKPEKTLYEFTMWLANRFEAVPELATPTVYDGGNHGWVEAVEPREFDSRSDIGNYYERAGTLTCVLYALGMTDCHSENIIATDPSPVVVDAETVMSRTAGRDSQSVPLTDTLHGALTAGTVLGTAMLPVRIGNVDLSQAGLDGDPQSRGGAKHVHWEDINTDAMSIEYKYPGSEQSDNLPLLDGERIPPYQFVPEVLAGFRRTYDVIQQASDLVTRQIWDEFTDIRLRVVVTATRVYDAITRTITNPSQLENGAIHSGTVEGTLLRKTDDDQLFGSQEILDAERNALLARDIPKFLTRARGDRLLVNYAPIDSFQFEQTPLSRVESTVHGMSPSDRAFQSGLIEACLSPSEQPDGIHNTRGL